MLGILTRLAGFSLRNPKFIMLIALSVAVAGFGVHYKLLKGERDKLRIAEVGYRRAVSMFEQREKILAADLAIAEQASRNAIREREASRVALDTFREGRKDDPESVAWGATLVPLGELARLCTALPELVGCE